MLSKQSFAAVALAAFPCLTNAFSYPDCVNGPLAKNLVCNPQASDADRAAALVAAMNITEKLAQLVDNAPGVARLGLAPYEWWSEALHGVAGSPGVNYSRNGGPFSYATSFPQPILTSAAFDDQLVLDIATIISTEARAFSNDGRTGLDFFTPNINGYRDPRWGRGQETPGEDVYHIARYTKNLLIGLEGGVNPPLKKVIATCKHFAGYDLEQNRFAPNIYNRFGYNAFIDTQDLAEYYLPPFQQCARDSRVGSMMCSYNAINGIPACANKYIMQDIARDHWNWTDRQQYITSDCNAIIDISSNHNYTATSSQATAISLIEGTDQVCQVGPTSNQTGAYAEGLLTEAVVDTALRRQYEGLVTAGYFDPASEVPYRKYTWNDVNTPQAQALALKTAQESLVLLKNDGTLPLAVGSKKVAMIGFWANATTQLQGDYSGPAPYIHNPVYAAQQRGINYVYATGPIQQALTANISGPALAAAESADVILYFGGIDTSIEVEGLDRVNITWPASQVALVSQLAALGKPLVIVQLGTMIDNTAWLQDKNVSGMIWAGYPSQDGGTAVLDVITGKVAPAGRLPITQYPAAYVNEVVPTDQSLRPSNSSPGRTYKWFDGAVQPFGYGLHYTKFIAKFGNSGPHSYNGPSYDIGKLQRSCNTAYPDLTTAFSVNIEVYNAGKVNSDFVALAFVQNKNGPKPYPIKELAGYTRFMSIETSCSQSAKIDITLGSLARRDVNGNLVLYPGDYAILLDVPTQATYKFTLTGRPWVLDNFPQPPADPTGGCTYCTPQTDLTSPPSGQ
ncbi:hypothetical protein LTR78_000015 [Recurvomyces mirabilis]|uniref:xylan 1,4-beta-xylosidase n=1 Tax=Recurvomyces mirabilis TaxID=574656 RepID=A0AAE1C627_9PEZI|nr:hypothetical protein LTR78_000015 [Recurvomyces mirabilis]KAK5161672.1 hypothetical protein LTS14_000016 [Recurvomyces mirabilis]